MIKETINIEVIMYVYIISNLFFLLTRKDHLNINDYAKTVKLVILYKIYI